MSDLKSDAEQQLILFEKSVYNGELQNSFDTLTKEILPNIENGKFLFETRDASISDSAACARLLSAYYHFIWLDSLNITDDGFCVLAKYTPYFTLLREQCAYRQYSLKPTEIKQKNKSINDKVNLAKKFILSTPPGPAHLKYLLKLPKRHRLAYLTGVLASKWTLTAEDEKYRQQIMRFICNDAPYEADPLFLDRISSAWMHCSYSLSPDKHEIKTVLNGAIKKLFQKNGYTDRDITTEISREKPTLLVISERLEINHAMYRCYGPSLESLKEFFYIINVVDQKYFDQGEYEWIDETIVIDPSHQDFHATLRQITDIEADVLLYPSLGMHYWSVALATLRLAPIQILLIGHPATSNSNAIDYVVMDEGFLADENTFSERIITLNRGTMPFMMREDAEQIEKGGTEAGGVINIAISAAMMKINHQFFSVCKKISERSKKEVVFHFFQGRGGLELEYFSSIASRLIGDNIVVYPPALYNNYIMNLGLCHLMLSPFPFGGTNSNIDAIVQGLPIVCLDGNQTHSHIDIEMMSRFGQPDWLSTNSYDEYIDAALRLIDNDSEREEIARYLSGVDPIKEFNCSDRIELGTAIDLLYNNHDKLQQLEQRHIHIDDLARL